MHSNKSVSWQAGVSAEVAVLLLDVLLRMREHELAEYEALIADTAHDLLPGISRADLRDIAATRYRIAATQVDVLQTARAQAQALPADVSPRGMAPLLFLVGQQLGEFEPNQRSERITPPLAGESPEEFRQRLLRAYAARITGWSAKHKAAVQAHGQGHELVQRAVAKLGQVSAAQEDAARDWFDACLSASAENLFEEFKKLS